MSLFFINSLQGQGPRKICLQNPDTDPGGNFFQTKIHESVRVFKRRTATSIISHCSFTIVRIYPISQQKKVT